MSFPSNCASAGMEGNILEHYASAHFLREHVQHDVQLASLDNDELSDAESNLSALENEITRMESILDTLRSQHAQDISRIKKRLLLTANSQIKYSEKSSFIQL